MGPERVGPCDHLVVGVVRLVTGREVLGVDRTAVALVALGQLLVEVAGEVDREAVLAGLSRALLGMEEESLALQHRVTDSRLTLSALRASREHGEADLARLVHAQEERTARVSALGQQIDAIRGAARRSQAERERSEGLCQELAGRATHIRADLVSAQEAHGHDADTARRVERDLASVRDALTLNREARTAVEVRRAEIKTQLAALESTLTGTYQLSVAAAPVRRVSPAVASGPPRRPRARPCGGP